MLLRGVTDEYIGHLYRVNNFFSLPLFRAPVSSRSATSQGQIGHETARVTQGDEADLQNDIAGFDADPRFEAGLSAFGP